MNATIFITRFCAALGGYFLLGPYKSGTIMFNFQSFGMFHRQNVSFWPKYIFSICGLFLFTSVFFIPSSNAVTIMSVDFGSEWMKIAVVAPGIPMEIALNHESKRKTPVTISYRNGERALGEDALSAGMKSPSLSYTFLLDLLGKKIDNPLVEIYKQRFPYYKIEEDAERGTVVFRQDEETTYSVEELVAQILNYAREIAMAHTNQKTKDIVITVPPFFNQAERRSLLMAAELAGLKVLSLMNTNAAVALNYGMFRRKEINETAQNILFYDMGSSSTTATIVSYQTVKTKERGFTETNPQVTILGVGFDRTLGGLEMQLRLRDYLGKKFSEVKKTSNDVFKSPRALAKLMKEAGKLKTVLSANTEHLSQIEGVLDDEDFRLKTKREEFETLCEDLFERVRGPVDAALVSAAIDISDIHQFIIVGGNTRVPKVQSILQEIWGKELGKNVNADEAAALGAVYRAADLGQGFKVLKFHVRESVVYPIEVDFERTVEKDDGTTAAKTVKRSLFALANSYPQKKVMTFNKHTSDFGFSVNYGDLSHLTKQQIKFLGTANVSYVMVNGVTSAFKKNLDDGAEAKGIKAHFSMDDSGLLSLSGIEAVFEKNITVEIEKEEEESTFSKIGSTLSKLFSGNEDEAENETDSSTKDENNTKETKKEDKNEEKQEEEKQSTEKGAKKEKKKEMTPKLVTIKEELNFSVNYLDLKPISEKSKKASVEKLHKMNEVESTRKEKERLKNTLESYILDVQDKLTQQEYEAASKEEDRNNVKQLAMQLENWIYDEGFDEQPSVYKDRLKSLEKMFEPIKLRVKEHHERPEALKALHDMINMSSLFLHRAQDATEKERWFTDIELKTLDELIISTQKWIEEKEEEQEKLVLSDDPILTLVSIAEKIGSLDREIKYLVNKGRIAKAKKEKEEAEAKIKEAEAKAKAEKEAQQAAKEQNKTEAENEEEQENIIDSRQEPPLPTEEEEERLPNEEAEENEGERNRRKGEEEDLDEEISSEEPLHTEL